MSTSSVTKKFKLLNNFKLNSTNKESTISEVINTHEAILHNIWNSSTGFVKGYPLQDKKIIKLGDLIEYECCGVRLPAIVKTDKYNDVIMVFNKITYNAHQDSFESTECPVEDNFDKIHKVQRLKTVIKSKTIWTTSILGILVVADPIFSLISSDQATNLLNSLNYGKVAEFIGVAVIMYERLKKLIKYNV